MLTHTYEKVILIVDDDPNLVHLLKKKLTSNGFVCLTASTVFSAINIMQNQKIDLVLLDLNLPGLDGTAFLSAAQDGQFKHVPILVTSSYTGQDIVDYIMDRGAHGFLPKPINQDHLLTRVADLVS